MLKIFFDEYELFDTNTEEFITLPAKNFRFMYNLVALDKWESLYKKRFLDNKELTFDDYLNFFKIMCLDDDLDVFRIGQKQFGELKKYIEDTPTATQIPKQQKTPGQRDTILTSEIIYGYMCLSGIPMEWENRNLNKLLVLINTIASLQTPPKKMTKQESMDEQRRIILERRKQMEERNANK